MIDALSNWRQRVEADHKVEPFHNPAIDGDVAGRKWAGTQSYVRCARNLKGRRFAAFMQRSAVAHRQNSLPLRREVS